MGDGSAGCEVACRAIHRRQRPDSELGGKLREQRVHDMARLLFLADGLCLRALGEFYCLFFKFWGFQSSRKTCLLAGRALCAMALRQRLPLDLEASVEAGGLGRSSMSTYSDTSPRGADDPPAPPRSASASPTAELLTPDVSSHRMFSPPARDGFGGRCSTAVHASPTGGGAVLYSLSSAMSRTDTVTVSLLLFLGGLPPPYPLPPIYPTPERPTPTSYTHPARATTPYPNLLPPPSTPTL